MAKPAINKNRNGDRAYAYHMAALALMADTFVSYYEPWCWCIEYHDEIEVQSVICELTDPAVCEV